MNDTAKTKLINSRDSAKSAQVPQQSQADLSGLQAQQSQTGLARSTHRSGAGATFPQLRGQTGRG